MSSTGQPRQPGQPGQPRQPGQPEQPGSSGSSGGRILVVEDDPDHAFFVLEVLRRGGFEVVHVTDPAEALRRVREPWDLMLTDVQMPGMTGLELLESVRKVAPELPVAVVTAHASISNVVIALRSRADEFLQKPQSPDQLIGAVTALVDKGRAARAASRHVVLAIGAHPDDVEIGAGGALAVHADLGHEVAILTLCRGSRGGDSERRAAESQEAAKILSAVLYLEDLEDTGIGEGDSTISVISQVINATAPTTIYTHSIHDVHQDHRNTHSAVMVAAQDVGRLYCYQSPSATVDFRPTRFVGIDRQLDRKLEAIASFDSQVELRTYLEPDLIQSIARSWSRFAEARYAEAFEVIRDRADIGSGDHERVVSH
jgi:LmbE family N-acetylglucosaminyl deacetylase